MPHPNNVQELPEPVYELLSPSENTPQSYEEALSRVDLARALYLGLEAPETGLPDTPELSPKDAIASRGEEYWNERTPLSFDTSIKGLAQKIDAPSLELYEWGVKKAILAQRVWAERTAGSIFIERRDPELPEGMTTKAAINSLHAEEADELLVSALLGKVKVIIQDGKAELVDDSYAAHSQEASKAIAKQITEWDQRHQGLVENYPRVAKVFRTARVLGPFATRMNPNKPGGMIDAAMMLYMHNAGEAARKARADSLPSKK